MQALPAAVLGFSPIMLASVPISIAQTAENIAMWPGLGFA
jgi:hypothetical protein